MRLVMAIRRVMKEYRASVLLGNRTLLTRLSDKALLRHSAIHNYQSPGIVALRSFKAWFGNKTPFVGRGANVHEANDLKWPQIDGVSDKFPQFIRNWAPYGRFIRVGFSPERSGR